MPEIKSAWRIVAFVSTTIPLPGPREKGGVAGAAARIVVPDEFAAKDGGLGERPFRCDATFVEKRTEEPDEDACADNGENKADAESEVEIGRSLATGGG